MMRKIFLAFCLIVIFSATGYAQDRDSNHDSHPAFYPASSFNLFGGVYNTATDQWHWYVGAKTLFFHPAKYVWVGGVGFGVAFAQKDRGSIPVLTLVPIKIGSLALEVSPYRVQTSDRYYMYDSRLVTINTYDGRLIMVTWNWGFSF